MPLALAVMFASDYYPHNDDPKTLSVTTLLNPIKQIILGLRVKSVGRGVCDLSDRVASVLGTANHDALTKAWKHPNEALRAVGINEEDIPRFVINDCLGKRKPVNPISVYTELRSSKKLLGWTISGEFDIAIKGQVMDMKNEKAYAWMKQTNVSKHGKQMSIYRWLNQLIIDNDEGLILGTITDWNLSDFRKNGAKYPPHKVYSQVVPLMSLLETEEFIKGVLLDVDKYIDLPEDQLPVCTPEDLWQGKGKWKYYTKVGNKTAANGGVFDNSTGAYLMLSQKGVGEVRHYPELAKKCNWCDAYNICNQRKQLSMQGLLAEK